MKQKLLTLSLGIATLFGSVNAQNRCGYDDYVNYRNSLKAGYKDALNTDIQELVQTGNERSSDFDGKLWTIQVVFHVVYRTANENIDSTLIAKQIKRLNLDYSSMNTDKSQLRSEFLPFASGDTRIRFELASVKPDGTPTNGIERRQTSINTFYTTTSLGDGIADNVKKYATGGLDPWDNTKYLNIWVCNFTPPTAGDGVTIGYATPPPGLAPYWSNDPVDLSLQGIVLMAGVVGDNTNASPYPQGRTLVHEIGHYLGLRHVWGDAQPACGEDYIWDTPPAAEQLIDYGPGTANNNPCSGITKTVRKFRVTVIGTTTPTYPTTYTYVDNDSVLAPTFKIVFNQNTNTNDTVVNKRVRIDFFDSIANGNTLPDADSTRYLFAYPAGYTNYWLNATVYTSSTGTDSVVIDTTASEFVPATATLTNQTYTKALVPNTCDLHMINPNTFVDYGDMPDMFENYMFYASEKCQITFSNGQRQLMQSVLKYRRPGIAVVTVNGIKEQELAGKLLIAPNPANESIRISNVEMGSVYTISNIAGSTVLAGKIESKDLDISSLSDGVYTVRVQNNNSALVSKLVVTK